MGVGYCSTPKEVLYHGLDYENQKAVQGLLRFYFQLKAETHYKPNFELVAILTDIEIAIRNCEFTDTQCCLLKDYMKGFTEKEIAERFRITQQGVSKQIKCICKKISEYLIKGAADNEQK